MFSTQLNLFVIIPAFNAERTIARVIHGCVSVVPRENIIVVDDGSTDKTRNLVEQSGATIIVHANNRGKGAALRSGFSAALKYGCEAVITLDADLQHDPNYIVQFVELLEKREDLGIVIGSRWRSGTKMPLDRRFSNSITSFLISIRTGQRIPDSQSGYRLIKRAVLEKVVTYEDRFMAETELLLKASSAGFKIGSVHIPTIYDGESSHINKFSDTVKFISLYIRSYFW
ncbi:MAG: glycosyltransferase family 2 protein [Candidatus Marinimicrobia bacterium]|nr:glycosyltransferase family 2 protein [Candidatus Neomarinimicrobiota bacterium]